MSSEMREIDTEKIILEAKTSAATRGYPDTVLPFSSIKTDEYFDMSDFNEWAEQANKRHAVSYYTLLEGSGPGVLVKKFARKMMSFILLPLVQQQNSFNVSIASSVNCLKKFIIDTGKTREIERAESAADAKLVMERFEYYEEMLKKMSDETVFLRQKVEQLEKQVAETKVYSF